jgi:hypothetical protein
MTEVHYFPRYSQRENVITNNTLLLLLRLYDHDRFKFGKFLQTLWGDAADALGTLGLQFTQQRRAGGGVPDGFIAQESVKIVVETKRAEEAFSADQLRRHLDAFSNEDRRLLVLLSPAASTFSGDLLGEVQNEAKTRGVSVLPTTFEGIIEAARSTLPEHDEVMRALVDDFAAFCSSEELLPRDGYTMFVPPCSQSFAENVKFRLYYCPAAWNRRRTAYLGMYWDKAVRNVGRIAKAVACDIDLDAGTVAVADPGVELTGDERQRIVDATRSAAPRWDISRGHRFLLCDELEETECRKVSPGGIQGHRYFDLADLLELRRIPADLRDLATALRGRTWQ